MNYGLCSVAVVVPMDEALRRLGDTLENRLSPRIKHLGKGQGAVK